MLMRKPCRTCGWTEGFVVTKGGQDTVRCSKCNAYAGYNAPKSETGKAHRSIQSTHEKIKPSVRAKVIERALGRCEECGKSCSSTILHVGHFISVKDGHEYGLTDAEINHPENLICQCEECNLGFSDRPRPIRVLMAILKRRIEMCGVQP